MNFKNLINKKTFKKFSHKIEHQQEKRTEIDYSIAREKNNILKNCIPFVSVLLINIVLNFFAIRSLIFST
jgi:hypothetical protein